MADPENNPEVNNGYEKYFHRPIAYSLPHDWGHFSVSEAAHDAYKLVPLTPNVTKAGIDRSILSSKAIEILLLGPAEDPSWSQINVPRGKEATSRIKVSQPYITAAKGIQIICSFERTRQEILAAELEKHARLNKVNVKQLINSFATTDGIPVGEHLDQHVSTTLIHGLYQALFLSVEQGYMERRVPLLRWLPISAVLDRLSAKTVADEVHNDLCPEYFEQQFEPSLPSVP